MFGVDAFEGVSLGVGVLHTLSYIFITDLRTNFLRTGIWVTSAGLCFNVIGRAAGYLIVDWLSW